MSKRSLTAVITFMSTGVLTATMCSPECKFANYIYTGREGIEQFYPNEQSNYYSTILIAISIGITIPLLITNSSCSNSNDSRKLPIASLSASLLAAGLNLSGMTKNYKIFGFLDLKGLKTGSWDPTLMCVMGGGLLVSTSSYHFVKGYNLFRVSE